MGRANAQNELFALLYGPPMKPEEGMFETLHYNVPWRAEESDEKKKEDENERK